VHSAAVVCHVDPGASVERWHTLEDPGPLGCVEVADHDGPSGLAGPRAPGVPAGPAGRGHFEAVAVCLDGLDAGIDIHRGDSDPAGGCRPDAARERLEAIDPDALPPLDRYDGAERARLGRDPQRWEVG
jgi:hypothetical protein